jgi:hypothetical protein
MESMADKILSNKADIEELKSKIKLYDKSSGGSRA